MIEDWDWRLGFRIGDQELGLEIGNWELIIRIRDRDW